MLPAKTSSIETTQLFVKRIHRAARWKTLPHRVTNHQSSGGDELQIPLVAGKPLDYTFLLTIQCSDEPSISLPLS